MSWAMRRRILYALGVFSFLLIVIGGPVAYLMLSVPETCVDGKQNQTESAPDMGGPCPLADVHSLAPSSVMWARAFKIRDGAYSAAAYIQNPNDHAGFGPRPFTLSLYDSQNILIAEKKGYAFAMPGGITPVYIGDIDTGNRIATHAFFEFTAAVPWLQLSDSSGALKVSNRQISGETSVPRIEATVTNTDVTPRVDASFIAVVFDTAGNAIAASATHLDRIEAGQSTRIVFTWPSPFTLQIGRVDIIPVTLPKKAWKAPCVVSNTNLVVCSNK